MPRLSFSSKHFSPRSFVVLEDELLRCTELAKKCAAKNLGGAPLRMTLGGNAAGASPRPTYIPHSAFRTLHFANFIDLYKET